ncbi:hypothetical protein H7F37_03170 [Winogradskyella sp. PAMC22761]|nr:hypothetical protein H7F37_03170 [Winogradskyella sp. PAMC22761]
MNNKEGLEYFKELGNYLKESITDTSFVDANSYVYTKCCASLDFDVLIGKNNITLKYPFRNEDDATATSLTQLLNNSITAGQNNFNFIFRKHYTQPNKVYYFYWDLDISHFSFQEIAEAYSKIQNIKF